MYAACVRVHQQHCTAVLGGALWPALSGGLWPALSGGLWPALWPPCTALPAALWASALGVQGGSVA